MPLGLVESIRVRRSVTGGAPVDPAVGLDISTAKTTVKPTTLVIAAPSPDFSSEMTTVKPTTTTLGLLNPSVSSAQTSVTPVSASPLIGLSASAFKEV